MMDMAADALGGVGSGPWLLIERTMPDFGQRREWLTQHGGRLVALQPTSCGIHRRTSRCPLYPVSPQATHVS